MNSEILPIGTENLLNRLGYVLVDGAWRPEELDAAKPAEQEALWLSIADSFYPPPVAVTIQACLDTLDRSIVRGSLSGDGFDKTAQRNGLILAYNLLFEMLPVGAARVPDRLEQIDCDSPDRLARALEAKPAAIEGKEVAGGSLSGIYPLPGK